VKPEGALTGERKSNSSSTNDVSFLSPNKDGGSPVVVDLRSLFAATFMDLGKEKRKDGHALQISTTTLQ
jgi:hypothetical protein